MTGSITLGALCVIVLVVACLRIGVFWTLVIAICSTSVGAVMMLSGIAGQILHAVATAAAAFGTGGGAG